jgi:hypothetical protein
VPYGIQSADSAGGRRQETVASIPLPMSCGTVQQQQERFPGKAGQGLSNLQVRIEWQNSHVHGSG